MCCLRGNAPAAAVGHRAGGPRAARVGAGVARPGSASRDRDTGSSRAVHARSATPAGAGSGSAAQTGQPQAARRPRRGRVAPARHALDSGEPLSPIQCELRGDGLHAERRVDAHDRHQCSRGGRFSAARLAPDRGRHALLRRELGARSGRPRRSTRCTQLLQFERPGVVDRQHVATHPIPLAPAGRSGGSSDTARRCVVRRDDVGSHRLERGDLSVSGGSGLPVGGISRHCHVEAGRRCGAACDSARRPGGRPLLRTRSDDLESFRGLQLAWEIRDGPAGDMEAGHRIHGDLSRIWIRGRCVPDGGRHSGAGSSRAAAVWQELQVVGGAQPLHPNRRRARRPRTDRVRRAPRWSVPHALYGPAGAARGGCCGSADSHRLPRRVRGGCLLLVSGVCPLLVYAPRHDCGACASSVSRAGTRACRGARVKLLGRGVEWRSGVPPRPLTRPYPRGLFARGLTYAVRMVLPLVVVLLQAPQASAAAPADARAVRVWFGSSSVLTRGTPVRVYVQAVQDGNLIVLHRRTDGRIDVLFPSKPSQDPFVRSGTYEIQATPSGVAFVVAEPDGSGLVLAALAPKAYRFDEFVRAAAWDPDALAPSWDGSDGEGVLSDIVQRMLGDGYFNYDIATYTVAPPVYAMQQDTGVQYPLYPTCTDCTFIGVQQNVFESLVLCDPFFSPCIGDGRLHHGGRRHETPAAAPTSTIALSMRGSSATPVIPRDGRARGGTGFARKASTPAGGPIEPRARAPRVLPRERASLPIRAVPLGPATAPTRRRIVNAPAEPAPGRVVSLTLTPTRVREEPAEAPRSSRSIVLTGLTVSPPPVHAEPRLRSPVSRREALAMQVTAPMMVRERGLAVAGGQGSSGGQGAATTGRTQGIALPPALLQGAQARVPVTRTGV